MTNKTIKITNQFKELCQIEKINENARSNILCYPITCFLFSLKNLPNICTTFQAYRIRISSVSCSCKY